MSRGHGDVGREHDDVGREHDMGPEHEDAAAETRAGEIRRFGLSTRWVHRTTAFLFGVCIATAAVLYVPQFAILFGRRPLVMTVHLYSGLALPVPTLLGWLAGLGLRDRSGAGFRRDTAELNRFGPADGAWLRDHLIVGPARRLRRRPPATSTSITTTAAAAVSAAGAQNSGKILLGGKFNAGQKLYAAGVAGSIVVFLGTGLLMWFGADLNLPDRYRTGATFVHDLFAYGIFFAACGHLWMASRDPVARAGMRTGYVPSWWATTEHPHWDTRTNADPAPITQKIGESSR